MVLTYLFAFVAALGVSFLLTWSVRNAALVYGLVAGPSSERHIHCGKVPRLGGVAIFLTHATVVSLSVAYVYLRGESGNISSRIVLYILLPGTLIFLLGLFDDLRPVSPYLKFSVQGVAAIMLYAGGFRIGNLPILFGNHQLSAIISVALTVLWVLGITNAFNLIDGLDGLAAGSALFATFTVFVVALVHHNPLVQLLAIVLAGSIAGFLRFNFNPATIFLGDCGSLFIGFLLSALALASAEKSSTLIAVAIPVVSFGLPILDTAISVLRRFLSGKELFRPDREHIHHKLLQLGFTHRKVVILLYAVSAAFGFLSLFLLYPGGAAVGMVLFVVGLGIWIGVQHLGYQEFVELRRAAQRTIEQKRVIANNLTFRRATDRIRQAESFEEILQILKVTFTSSDFRSFELVIATPEDHLAFLNTDPLTVDTEDNRLYLYRWRSPGQHKEQEGGWVMSVDLRTSSNRRVGSLAVCRNYQHKSLMLDMNLLVAGFPTVLADAIERFLTSIEAESKQLPIDVKQSIRVPSSH